MTYAQFYAARQLIAEERLGAPLRAAQRAEIAKVEQTKAAIRKSMPKSAAPRSYAEIAADARAIAERMRAQAEDIA